MNKAKVSKMVGVALLMAMVIVLQFVSSMIPPIGFVSISLVLIPIVLGAATYGVGAGALLGATFATVTIINCVTGADLGGAMIFQANPILCILVVLAKSVFAGVASGSVYRLLNKRNGYMAMLGAAIVCPVVNTGIFLSCVLVFFKDVIASWATGAGADVATYVLSILLLCNFLPELIINIVFGTAGHHILRAVRK